MLRLSYLALFIVVACHEKQPRPPATGSGETNPCAQYADGICPLYNGELDGSGSKDQIPKEKPIINEQITPQNDEHPTLYTGFVLRDKGLYPLFLADHQQQITKSKFSYGGAGFETQQTPETNGLQLALELTVTLEFVVDSKVFCARTSLDKSRLGKILQWQDRQLQAEGVPLAKEKDSYPNLRKMNVKEGE